MEPNPPWGILTNNNHYLVDLNRESIWATQKESAALRDFYYEWNPMVFIDLHGEYDNFVGPGYTEPLNPLYTEAQRHWFGRFGKAIDKKFAGLGWSYSSWETGSFYPGFWESFGALNGAIGFTYETIGGGSSGLRYRRDDGSIITLKLAAEQHFQASLAAIETSVGAREELMEDFAAFWRSARVAEEQAFLLERGSDPARADLLIEMLLANRVEVFKSRNELSLTNVHDYFGRHWNERSFPAGVYVVPVAQPQARLVLTMLRKDFELPKVTRDAATEFRRNQEKAGFYHPNIGTTGYIFYDITAWSMPLTFNVPAYWTEAPVVGDLARVDAVDRELPLSSPEAQYGYVFRGESNASMALLIDLIQQRVVTNVAYSDFRIHGRDYRRGSIVIRKERNPGVDLDELLGAASERHGVRIDALDSNYSEVGPSLGSDQFVFVKPPKIAVLAGDPVSVRSFGNAWFILEQSYELAFTAIYKEQLNESSLDEYNVLVLPDGYYDDRTFPEQWIEALEAWIRRGGTLVCFKGASAWVSNLDAGLTSARMREPIWPQEATESVKPRRTASIPGAILRAVPDEHHYLSLGYDGPTPVLVHSNLAFEPDPSLAAPLTFSSSARNLLLSGFAYGDSVERLAGTPYVIEERVGSGHVILFLDDPTFRVYWYGLARLFLNAILLSPSF